MISYEWRTDLSAAEADDLADVLGRAATYDAEPGYSSIDFDDVRRSMAEGRSADRHLVIWMLAHATTMAEPETPECIAGLLRLTGVSEGAAEATVVVDPRLRSIGIVTLLIERVGLDTTGPAGWLGTGAHTITAWARGNHPATGRLSNRFLVPRTRRVWQLIRGTQPDHEQAAAPVLEPTETTGGGVGYALRESGRVVGTATLSLNPLDSEEFGACAVIDHIDSSPSAPPGSLRHLLEGVAVAAHEAGRPGVIVNVDSDDLPLVNAARLAGFHHDRTDVRYQLGGTP